MAILITGGTGFLGSHLARKLVDSQAGQIILMDAYPNPSHVADMADQVKIVRGDFSETTELLAVLKSYDISHIFHLAYLTSDCENFPAQAIRINIQGTNSLFEAARLFGVQKVCYASSAAVYRKRRTSDRLMHEDDLPAPTSFYGMCKLANEHTAELYYLKHGLKHVGLRLQAIYGPGRGTRRNIPPDIYAQIVERPWRGERLVTPRSEAVMAWTYVEDAAEAFYAAFRADDPPHRVFNVTGEIQPVGEVVAFIKSLLPGVPLEIGDRPADTMPLARGERIREELGFVPRFSMRQGIGTYLERLKRSA
jgi:UDP-glucose 4-epimerase